MSDHRSPPPAAVACLERPRLSSQKGGTLIAEDVTDLSTHDQRICDPDGYRPRECQNCNHTNLHMHDRRTRLLLSNPDVRTITISIYRCASCKAIWRILPLFMARYLWRGWRIVESTTGVTPPSVSQPKVPDRTQRRWKERLRSSARTLVQLLATSGNALLEAVVHPLGIDATRVSLVVAYAAGVLLQAGTQFASFSALIHRLGPGLRFI